jgi:Zn-dependent metalloprotease
MGADPRVDVAFFGGTVSEREETGLLRFAGTTPDTVVELGFQPGAGTPEDYGLAFASEYGAAFGIENPSSQLRLMKTNFRPGGGHSVRYQQMYHDVPVFAGELVVNLDHNLSMLSMNGEIAPDLALGVTPTLDAVDAAYEAMLAVAKWHGVDSADLVVSLPELYVYDARLLKPSMLEPSLVWHIEVVSVPLAPIRELVLVEAHSGAIMLHFNQVNLVRDRITYDAMSGNTLPGNQVCIESDDVNTCSAGDSDVANVHTFAGDAYDFYSSTHGRDSFDGVGGTILSTVHYWDAGDCAGPFKAFWNGTQMVFCETWASADDIVGHEFTHAVTDSESDLYYYWQSGAISESLADIWGEFIDLTNGAGDDSPGVRWQIGEDLSSVERDLRFPETLVPPHPDRMTSFEYFKASSQNGGVHRNSTIGGKAAYLITDGDTFNGETVTGLGITKTAKIYYEAQTNLLTSGSDYGDLYHILHQACINLVGSHGIVADDCEEVRKATDAVEMNLDPAGDPDFSPEALVCPENYAKGTELFNDDMESGLGTNWDTSTLSGFNNDWVWGTGYATSGAYSLSASNKNKESDSVLWTHTAVNLPTGAFLHFRHAFGFESGGDFFDGGVIEYSTDGTTWQDLGTLFDDGQDYGGTIATTGLGNTLEGRDAFVDESHGYVSSRYDLGGLSGQDFQVRFRVGSDESEAGPLGWTVDDVMIHQCDALFDISCSGVDVLIKDREFSGDTLCLADNTLAANTAVIVKSGATVSFKSPSTALGPGFSVETGGVFTVDASL